MRVRDVKIEMCHESGIEPGRILKAIFGSLMSPIPLATPGEDVDSIVILNFGVGGIPL